MISAGTVFVDAGASLVKIALLCKKGCSTQGLCLYKGGSSYKTFVSTMQVLNGLGLQRRMPYEGMFSRDSLCTRTFC
eukprot:5403958-Amphidinium_carterae.1